MTAETDFHRALDKALTDCGQRGQMERYLARLERKPRTILIPEPVFDRMLPHASRRGITRAELAEKILRAVIWHDLVDAVLDDARARA